MRTTFFRISCMAMGLLGPVALSAILGPTWSIFANEGHATGLMARITMRDGTVGNVKLAGVGCALGICSRSVIKGRAGESEVKSWLDSLAAIRDTDEKSALFVGKDGTSQRLSLVKDFRVLYLANRLGGGRKVDLAQVRSVEFLDSRPR